MRFEDRLRKTASSLLTLGLVGLAGCVGQTKTDSTSETGTPDLSGLCAGDPPPTDYQLATGFVTITPGGTCPDAADAQLEVFGCTFLEWQDITCSFTRSDTDQVFVNDGYGGFFADEATAPTTTIGTNTGPREVVDVCYYEGVFYLPPDHPTCGRPLLHEGEVVVAEACPGLSGWIAGPTPLAAALSEAERAEVGAYWLGAALLEHASVASFARASLDLMRFGAPPELLAATHRAALDEIDHAQRCFALASAYRGEAVGPGPLGVGGLPEGSGTLAAFAEALVREGCVGETLAALDAAARLAHATDPAVRATLEVILRDESAHAALAWRTLAWVLGQDADGAVRAALALVFAEERLRWTTPPGASPEVGAAALAHGLLPAALRSRALARAFDEVIAPAWAAAA